MASVEIELKTGDAFSAAADVLVLKYAQAFYGLDASGVASLTGDVLAWVRSRIRSASLVVADLTDANPNVYLEVVYAWGAGIPTVLVVKNADHSNLMSADSGAWFTRKIKELEDSLTSELRSLHPGD